MASRSSPTTINTNVPFSYSSPVLIGTGKKYIKAQVGNRHAAALDSNNTLYIWGQNTVGQLGDNLNTSSVRILDVADDAVKINNIQDFAISNSTMFAIDTSNNLYAWGHGNTGIIGTNKTDDSSWLKLSAGEGFIVGIKNDYTMWAWGYNDNGQLGTNDIVNRSAPTQISGSWADVSAGKEHVLAIDHPHGRLFAWGNNTYGQLGTTLTTGRSSPVQITSLSSFTSVAAGETHSLAVSNTGTTYVWGWNLATQLFRNDATFPTSGLRSSPVALAASAAGSKVYAGSDFSFIRYSNGTVRAAGLNNFGQLGDGTIVSSNGVNLSINFDDLVVSSVSNTVFGFSNTGNTYVWGQNKFGILGLPFNLPDTSRRYSQPVTVGDSILATDNTNVLYAIGGSIANTTNTGVRPYQSTLVSTILTIVNSSINVATLAVSSNAAASNLTAAVIASNNLLYMWGSNLYGQVGDNTTITRSNPTAIAPTTSFTFVAPGSITSAGINADGQLLTWGNNSSYQLGTGSDVITDFSASLNHMIAVDSNGNLFTWGNNTSGALGINIGSLLPTGRSSPVRITTSSFSQVSAGDLFNLAIDSIGRLFAWGFGPGGRLGINASNDRSSPTQVAGSWIKVSAMDDHSLGIKTDGYLYGWGVNNIGQLGDNSTITKSSPVLISTDSFTQLGRVVANNFAISAAIRNDGGLFVWGPDHFNLGYTKPSIVQISSTGARKFAIDQNGQLWAWGNNVYGTLGTNDVIRRSAPTQVGNISFTNVSAATNKLTFGVSSNGNMYIWGEASGLTLGESVTTVRYRSNPTQVFSGTSWTFATGDGSLGNFALDNNSKLYGWGTNTNKQLDVLGPANSFTKINGMNTHYAGISTNNKLFTWGLNSSGQLGISSLTNSSSPVQVGTDSVIDTSAGSAHTLFIKANGTLWAMGQAGAGRLGEGTTAANRSEPVQIGSANNWVKVVAYNDHSAAINAANELYTWGAGGNGKLGLNDTLSRSNPTQVTGSWTDVLSGMNNLMAIAANGDIFAWGLNTNGQLGINSTIARSSPVFLTTNTNVISAKLGLGFGALLYSNNHLFMWGGNALGYLGINTSTDRSSPVLVSTNASSIAVNYGHTFANIDGSIYTWGLNSSGQLGINSTISRSSPTLVTTHSYNTFEYDGLGLNTFVKDNNNDYYGWGLNSSGQLGNFLTTNRSSPVTTLSTTYNNFSAPVIVDAAKSFVTVSTCGLLNHIFAIDSDGRLYAWGNNQLGQLGLGDTIARSSPTQVAGSWSKISARNEAILGIKTDGTLWAWGNNRSGSLGLNLAIAALRSNPVQVGSETYWVDVDSYLEDTTINGRDTNDIGGVTALANTGDIYGWGTTGLGSAETTNRSSPALVGSANASKVAINMALVDGRRVKTYGQNTEGEKGVFSVAANNDLRFVNFGINRSSPVQVGTDSWIKIAAGDTVRAGIKADGTLWTWGNNFYGTLGINLGINSFDNSDIPVQVGNDNTWVDVVVMDDSTSNPVLNKIFAIKTEGSNNEIYGWGQNAPLQSFGYLNNATAYSSPVKITSSNPTLVLSGINRVEFGAATGPTVPFLYTWGENQWGRLGNGNTSNTNGFNTISLMSTNRSSPVVLSNFGSFTKVTINGGSALAIKTNGSLWAWGLNSSGQLGVNSIDNVIVPQQVGSSSWTAVQTNGSVTAGIDVNGRLFMWGSGLDSMTGQNNSVSYSSPVQITSNKSFTQVSVGRNTVAAITTGQELFTWGNNTFYGLGLANSSLSISSPTLIGTGYVSASVDKYLVAISNTGEVYGSTSANTITNDGLPRTNGLTRIWPDHPHRSSPVSINSNLKPVAVGDGAGLFASVPANTIIYTGLPASADNVQISRSSPTQLDSGATSLTLGAVGNSALNTPGSTIYYTKANTLFSRGYNVFGSLGVNSGDNSVDSELDNNVVYFVDLENKSSPTLIGTGFNKVYADASHVAAIASNGSVFTWGNNSDGELGIGTYAFATFPTPLDSNVSFSQIAIGNNFMAGISNGNLYTWGKGTSYQLGNGETSDRLSPVQVANTQTWSSAAAVSTGLYLLDKYKNLHFTGEHTFTYDGNGWDQIAVGGKLTNTHYIGIKNGQVYTWGNNFSGQLGTGNTVGSTSPILITGLSNVVKVAADHVVSGALTSNGNLYLWGNNFYGALGTNSIINRSSPVLVQSNVIDFDISQLTGASITSNNSLFVWGYQANYSGGLNSTVSRSSPTIVSSQSAKKVKTTYLNTIYISTNNEVYSAGYGPYGTNGDGAINTNVFFNKMLDITDAVEIDLDLLNAYIITSNGQMYATGNSSYGKLGPGNGTPIKIANTVTQKWIKVTGADFTKIGLTSNGSVYVWGRVVNTTNNVPIANSSSMEGLIISGGTSAGLTQITGITASDIFSGRAINGYISNEKFAYSHGYNTTIGVSNLSAINSTASAFGNTTTTLPSILSETTITKQSNTVWSEINSSSENTLSAIKLRR